MKATLEQIDSASRQSFVAYRYQCPRFVCPYHFHPEMEVTLIVNGEGHRLVGDHFARFQSGDLVLHGANLPHTYFHGPDFDAGPQGVESIVVQFRPELLQSWLTAPECQKISRLMIEAQRGIAIEGPFREEVARLMHLLVEEKSWRRWNLLLELLGVIAEHGPFPSLAGESFRLESKAAQVDRIERVCAWLSRNFQERVTLTQAAQQAHLTPAAFSRFFRKTTNRTFVDFVNELRVGHACRFLLDTDHGIAWIASEAGFANLSNFNRRFQQLRGTTPLAFRRAGSGKVG